MNEGEVKMERKNEREDQGKGREGKGSKGQDEKGIEGIRGGKNDDGGRKGM